jgi:dihydroxyacetone kinase DhaKLM complex PTS-EIIA-like component DhaM
MNIIESMERQIIKALVTEAFKRGFTKIIIDNGGDDEEQITCTDTKEVMASIQQTDEEVMFFVYPDFSSPPLSVYLVYGNDGYDVIADHSSSLNEIIDTIQPLIDTLEAQFHGV